MFFDFVTRLDGVFVEQRYAIKFCVRLGKNATETFQMLQEAFWDDCISSSQSGRWHKAFKEGWEETADEPCSGRPTTARTDENVNHVREFLRSDRRLSIQQIADTLNMSTWDSAWDSDRGRRVARVRADIKDTVHHHDNAPSHTAFIVTNFLAQSNTPYGTVWGLGWSPNPLTVPTWLRATFFCFPD